MEDAQFPSVAGDAQGTPQRRSGLRLSDAETVATTRLDMFGDTALNDTLASAPPGPADTGAANGTVPEAPADQPVDAAEPAVDGPGPAAPEPPAIEEASQLVEAAPEQPPTDPAGPDAAGAAADLARDLSPPALARVPLDVPAPDRLSAALPRPAARPAHMEFAPVFRAELRSQGPWNGEDRSAQPLHEAQGQDDAVAETAASDAAAPADAEAPMAAAAAPEDSEGHAVGEPEAVPPDSPEPPQLRDFSPPFPDASVGGSGPSSPPPFREDLAPPVPVFDAAAPSTPPLDAAAKIAAEANATAHALENLKRLLETDSPDLEPVVSPIVHSEPVVRPRPMIRPLPMAEPDEAFGARAYAPPRGEGLRIGPQTEAPSLAGTVAPMLPLPVPPPPERSSRRGLYLLGFLTGLGLSLMTGILLYFVLYFVINTTG